MADEENSAVSDKIRAALDGKPTTFIHGTIPISESMMMHARAIESNKSTVNCSYKDANKNDVWRFVKPLGMDDEVTEQVHPGDEVYVLYAEVTLKETV